MWKKLGEFDEKEVSKMSRLLSSKIRLLFDEHFDPLLIEAISSKYHAKHIRDFNLTGHPDENIYNFACQNNYVLVTTNEKDFWDDNPSFPLKTSKGVLCLSINPGESNKAYQLITEFCEHFGIVSKILKQTKSKINEKEIILKMLESGKTSYYRIDLFSGEVFEKN